jgi:hypothetical protein
MKIKREKQLLDLLHDSVTSPGCSELHRMNNVNSGKVYLRRELQLGAMANLKLKINQAH